MTVTIMVGDVREQLRKLPDNHVHCVVTSPPYWGLRDYGVDGQIGLEASPAEFIATMVEVFEEVRRVLRPDGTCWVNMGDSYNAGTSKPSGASKSADVGGWTTRSGDAAGARRISDPNLKVKDLCMMPHRLAIALQDAGWWVRQDIIWHKPNPMPESIKDRCTKAHEYIFLLTKSERYYFDADAIAEAVTDSTVARLSQPGLDAQIGSDRVPGKTNGNMKAVGSKRNSFARTTKDSAGEHGQKPQFRPERDQVDYTGTRNKRSVWTMSTQPFKEAHFATFPPELPETCIKAGTSEKGHCPACGERWVRLVDRKSVSRDELPKDDPNYRPGRYTRKAGGIDDYANGGGQRFSITQEMGWSANCQCGVAPVPDIVLDIFFGAGTTGLVADRLQRDCIGIELNPAYAEIARKRIVGDSTLFSHVEVAA